MITIVDIGLGNLNSIKNALDYLQIKSQIEDDISKIKKSSKIILSGVGSFDAAMKKFFENGLKETLDEKVLIEKVPVLGICLGMQLMSNKSEEGERNGLRWIDAETLSFKNRIDQKYKIPHIGWNKVKILNSSPLLKGIEETQISKYYFVHSYFVKINDRTKPILKTNYGIDFVSAFQKDNIYGVQFHPEKSYKYGMKILENFAII